MRTTCIFLALPLLLCACAEQAGPGAPQLSARCDAQTAQFLVGEPYSDALGEQARSRSGAALLRVLRVGEVASMEFNAERLTIQLDREHRVGSVRCG